MKIMLDAAQMTDRESSHRYLKDRLSLPDYYGGNLDALYDCLTDFSDAEITFFHTATPGAYFSAVYRIFEAADRNHAGIRINTEA